MARATTRGTVAKARRLRRGMSLPEVKLWEHLRDRPMGLKFRRQHPIGPYVLDFYCAEAKAGIEIDGLAHDMGHRPERDAGRTAWLSRRGIAILRLPASEVLADALGAVEAICAAISARKGG